MKKIHILGTDCPKCRKLLELVTQLVTTHQLDAQVQKVSDINEILSYNVMMMPAMVVDGVVKVSGRLPSAEELHKLLIER